MSTPWPELTKFCPKDFYTHLSLMEQLWKQMITETQVMEPSSHNKHKWKANKQHRISRSSKSIETTTTSVYELKWTTKLRFKSQTLNCSPTYEWQITSLNLSTK